MLLAINSILNKRNGSFGLDVKTMSNGHILNVQVWIG